MSPEEDFARRRIVPPIIDEDEIRQRAVEQKFVSQEELADKMLQAYFNGLRCAVIQFAVWREGVQWIGFGRRLQDVLREIDEDEAKGDYKKWHQI